ncbi:tRNA uridine(34) 5-carboxymethylaminomethyl modification radical SAM/GNAT enzyme Elp3 [Salinarchaeum sp. IM2453]|uniref:tRNA uridine(34) 5-carboxymethylaminomethyl modification radical SAM/GNAT enzyme Elp3 n=1 Tax=Salinarchaeum sp. IM2453 TaxID=2862870 RepID=UPI001C8401B1|nr:tRNA uridine(34) 5-carboxymethylaminomethyl modification radical SAM/GNAT enzyme Elp3 [Salinarchaeum sp. IM2453]QZA89218.1 tRNA uridine(34) 5-carboxymethylaminomethyl modification radical SAM/GNAT enzyme Elp3 [Salinarchaeum sp. IM2453]
MSTGSAAESNTFERVCSEIINRILQEDLDRDDIEPLKREVCSEHSAPRVPKNTELLDHAPDGRREDLEAILQRKPVRTASGVSPVAIMTSPKTCPHGQCLYCPGGPDSEFSSAQSYTGDEPAAARAEQNDYDPYGQVTLRLNQLREIGHPVDKTELIVMGGTFPARSHDYQEFFVKRALEAMNDFDPEAEPNPAEGKSFAQDPSEYEFKYLEDIIEENETASVRNIATTFETKPDWCDIEQIDRMLSLGGTKVEVGVQTTFERVNREMRRGHGIQESIDANRRLRDAGFKVGFHMMPGQPGTSLEMVREDFRRIFEQSDWRPDYLKIYPTLVVPDTVVYDMHHRDEFSPLKSERAAELIADIKEMIPPYTRLQRVMRDIPAGHISAGIQKSNLRQLARHELEDRGETCRCIRCREVGMNEETPDSIELLEQRYEAVGGTEYFLSFEDQDQDLLIGFCRLRFPGNPHRPELQNAAIIRELHVYGNQIGIGKSSDDWQHQGYGKQLLARAEEITADAGYDRLAVISGIGAREYYRNKLEYEQDGPYVVKDL